MFIGARRITAQTTDRHRQHTLFFFYSLFSFTAFRASGISVLREREGVKGSVWIVFTNGGGIRALGHYGRMEHKISKAYESV